jgi:hypothetical protein
MIHLPLDLGLKLRLLKASSFFLTSSSSGGALAKAGPLGALLAYCKQPLQPLGGKKNLSRITRRVDLTLLFRHAAFIGTIAYSSVAAVGELTTFAPISVSIKDKTARWDIKTESNTPTRLHSS